MVLLKFVAISTIIYCLFAFGETRKINKNIVTINEENWRDILTSEWMLEFHAPWCPACRDLGKAWDSFADWSEDLRIKVAQIDVTESPGLSGRFLVTALPTIIHVKDGVFRQYLGARDKDDFISFIEDKKWVVIPPIPAWKYPDSPQMTVVSYFFKLSMAVRDLHNYLVDNQGIPSWGSYAIFALTTLVLGCILGFVIVYLIDFLFPTASTTDPVTVPKPDQKDQNANDKQKSKYKKQQQQPKKNVKSQQKEKKSDDEMSDVEKIDNTQSEGENSGSGEENARRRKK